MGDGCPVKDHLDAETVKEMPVGRGDAPPSPPPPPPTHGTNQELAFVSAPRPAADKDAFAKTQASATSARLSAALTRSAHCVASPLLLVIEGMPVASNAATLALDQGCGGTRIAAPTAARGPGSVRRVLLDTRKKTLVLSALVSIARERVPLVGVGVASAVLVDVLELLSDVPAEALRSNDAAGEGESVVDDERDRKPAAVGATVRVVAPDADAADADCP